MLPPHVEAERIRPELPAARERVGEAESEEDRHEDRHGDEKAELEGTGSVGEDHRNRCWITCRSIFLPVKSSSSFLLRSASANNSLQRGATRSRRFYRRLIPWRAFLQQRERGRRWTCLLSCIDRHRHRHGHGSIACCCCCWERTNERTAVTFFVLRFPSFLFSPLQFEERSKTVDISSHLGLQNCGHRALNRLI